MQKEGVMMGSPLGPTFANYYMWHLENETAKRCPETMPTIYARYVDDIFVVCESEENILAFREELERNSVLKFTHELENNNQLHWRKSLCHFDILWCVNCRACHLDSTEHVNLRLQVALRVSILTFNWADLRWVCHFETQIAHTALVVLFWHAFSVKRVSQLSFP